MAGYVLSGRESQAILLNLQRNGSQALVERLADPGFVQRLAREIAKNSPETSTVPRDSTQAISVGKG